VRYIVQALLLAGIVAIAAPAAQSPQVTAVRTLVDLGSTDGTWLVVVKAGVVSVEPVVIKTPGVGPVVPPDVEDPVVVVPPPTDLAKAFADAIAKVTETGKVQTAATLKSLIDPILAAAKGGTLTDVSGTKANLPLVVTLAVVQKPDWADFTAVFKTQIEKATTNADLAAVLGAASAELGKVK